ncbi:MAG: hypothetical protein ACI9HX_001492 [Pseudoalteromonas tetraodonis]|jgi:uncharacterized protein YgfB (UPF0149 family)
MNFEQLIEKLSQINAEATASECHGIVCGMLIAGYDASQEVGQQLASALDVDYALVHEWSGGLALQAQQSIGSADFSFTPWVPDDDGAFVSRLAALADWCDGMLYGMGAIGKQALQSAENEELREILADIVSIARQARIEDEFEGDSEDEDDFEEVLEYVRVGAQYLYQELVIRPLAHATVDPDSKKDPSLTLH